MAKYKVTLVKANQEIGIIECPGNKYILEAGPKMIKIAFCDWWIDEYGGGEFDEYNNFFTITIIYIFISYG
jgi:hypothetical protein